jgi:hypothetical protein
MPSGSERSATISVGLGAEVGVAVKRRLVRTGGRLVVTAALGWPGVPAALSVGGSGEGAQWEASMDWGGGKATFERRGHAVGRSGPGRFVVVLHGVDDGFLRVGEFDAFAAVTELTGEIADDQGGVGSGVVGDERAAVAGDDHEPLGWQGECIGEGEANAFHECPAGEVHGLTPGVMEFDPLEFLPIIGWVVHDLIDHDLGGCCDEAEGEGGEDRLEETAHGAKDLRVDDVQWDQGPGCEE